MMLHWKCPKEDCDWQQGRGEKEKRRHVWKWHRKWAEETKYPRIGGACDLCGLEFDRTDYIVRHKKEAHGGHKRDRKEGG